MDTSETVSNLGRTDLFSPVSRQKRQVEALFVGTQRTKDSLHYCLTKSLSFCTCGINASSARFPSLFLF